MQENAPYELPWPLSMSDALPPSDPGTWGVIRDAALGIIGALATLSSTMAMIIFNGIRGKIKNLDLRVAKLETERSEVAVMGTKLGSLAGLLEQSQERMEQHHQSNVLSSERDREITQNWRENVMTPRLNEIQTELELTKQRVGDLREQVKEAKDAAAKAALAAQAAVTAAARRRRGGVE